MKKLIFLLVLSFIGQVAYSQGTLPSVKLKDINGKMVDVSELENGGKPIIISFFATWCKPCQRELQAIHEVYPDWQDETGVKVIAVSIDQAQDANKVKPLVDSKSWEYEVLLDPNSELKRAVGVNMIPHVIILDGEGKIAYSHSGYVDGGEEELIEVVRGLVK